VTGRVDQFERVFRVRIGTTFNNDELANIWFLHGNARLQLPPAMRSLVRDVVPSYARTASVPATAVAARARAAARAPRRTGTWTRGCVQAKRPGAVSFE